MDSGRGNRGRNSRGRNCCDGYLRAHQYYLLSCYEQFERNIQLREQLNSITHEIMCLEQQAIWLLNCHEYLRNIAVDPTGAYCPTYVIPQHPQHNNYAEATVASNHHNINNPNPVNQASNHPGNVQEMNSTRRYHQQM